MAAPKLEVLSRFSFNETGSSQDVNLDIGPDSNELWTIQHFYLGGTVFKPTSDENQLTMTLKDLAVPANDLEIFDILVEDTGADTPYEKYFSGRAETNLVERMLGMTMSDNDFFRFRQQTGGSPANGVTGIGVITGLKRLLP